MEVKPQQARLGRYCSKRHPSKRARLEAPATFRAFFGLERRAQHLDVFVDRPEEFLEALALRDRPRPALTTGPSS
jgi:hypothetical protein